MAMKNMSKEMNEAKQAAAENIEDNHAFPPHACALICNC